MIASPDAGASANVGEAGGFPFEISGGVVAYNVEHRVEQSVRSLLDQQLPEGVRWDRIWVVASGCTDGTEDAVRGIARHDERVRLIVEPRRRGKAAALQEVLARSSAPALVLLNSDAVAQPGAVSAMLRRAAGRTSPFAVMARPVLAPHARGDWEATMRWMWELHHEFHLDLLADGRGAHLCDELLLLGGPRYPPIPPGVINDGSYLGVWLATHGGSCWYAPDARVEIEVPRKLPDHLGQRRRIHVGNAQITGLLGSPPTTLPRYFVERPRDALRVVARTVPQDDGLRHLARILAGEVLSRGLALWDRLPPRRDHVRWTPIERSGRKDGTVGTEPPAASPIQAEGIVERRTRTLLEIARRFGTGIPIDELVRLLPASAPRDSAEVERWLTLRPEHGYVAEGRAALGPEVDPRWSERVRRGASYRAEAHRLLSGPLSFAGTWTRCVTVTGSTAYGEPECGDDLDFFTVVRDGAVWIFLLRSYLALRLRSGRGRPSSAPTPCLNYVIDETSARRELADARGALFAREALTAIPIFGEDYYRGLLAGAPWMEREFPRLYAIRSGDPGSVAPRPASRLIRGLNAMVFPMLAAYLQAVGLYRNRGRRADPSDPRSFRTITGPGRLMFASQRFEELRESYRALDESRDPAGGALGGAGGPAVSFPRALR